MPCAAESPDTRSAIELPTLTGGPSGWDRPIWEVDLDDGLRLLRLAIDTHLITSHFLLPLLILWQLNFGFRLLWMPLLTLAGLAVFYIGHALRDKTP